jgi:hypothetical protein
MRDVITPYSTYYDAGFIELDEYTIKNYDGRGTRYGEYAGGLESVTQYRSGTYSRALGEGGVQKIFL